MATITKTYTESQMGASYRSTWTLTFTGTNATASGATVSVAVPTATAKYVYSGKNQAMAEIYAKLKVGSVNSSDFSWDFDGSWASGAVKTLTRSLASVLFNTSALFTSANKTVKTLNASLYADGVYLDSWKGSDEDMYNSYAGTNITIGNIATITLNVPPTFAESFAFTDDFSGVPYANKTTASVTLSSLAAYYGGDFTGVGSATFTIGSQSVTKANPADNDVLSIALNAVGTFIPTVSVTDSRGQTTTHTLNAITVRGYDAPSVSLVDADRTDANGVPEDEGTYATLNATFTFTDAIATLQAPSVTMTDENGTQTTPTVTWYSSRAADGTLSGSVNWASLSSGDTVYGLVPGLSTQYSYTISVRPRDDQGTGTAVPVTIGSAFYTVDFLAGGHGVAFGKAATRPGFDCDMVPFFNTWIGIVQQFAGSTAPDGWLICDGRAVSRTDYAALFAVIGTTYGTGDGSTTFNLPDLQGRVAIGSSGSYALGATGGEETHQLIESELPQITGKARIQAYNTATASGHFSLTNANYNLRAASSGTANAFGSVDLNLSFGSNGSHNNMQPYVALNYIIYAGV